jgi:hypothetical protein
VIGDVASALDLKAVDAARRQGFFGKEKMFAFGVAPERDHRFVLDDEPRCALLSERHRVVQPHLKVPDLAVRPAAEIEYANGVH